MEKYNNRNEVPEKYKWDLKEFYKDEKDFLTNLEKTQKEVEDLKRYSGCIKDANKLYEFLNESTIVSASVLNLAVYAYMINDVELGISNSMERKSKTEDLESKYNSVTSFFEPELLELSKEEYEKLFITNNKLNEYKAYLDDIYRNKEHILNEKEEIIVSELNSAMNHFSDMSSTMLNQEHDYGKIEIDGKEEIISSTNYRRLMKNDNRNIRKQVREQFNKTLDQYSVSSAQFLDSYVKSNVAECKIRKYKSCFDAYLFNVQMPKEIFDTLVKTTKKNYKSFHKYLRLFKKVHNFDKLYQYDLSLDFAHTDKKYNIEEAQALALEAIKPLGEEYYNCFKKVIDEKHIDYAQYKGKASGGYCISTYDRTSRILMSFNNDLISVSTIIHEGGHDVHHQFLIKYNKLHYRSSTTLTSEVTSLTNECLLSSYLARNGKTKEEKLSGIANIIDVFNGNLFDDIREAYMEEEFYKHVENGGTITKDYINKLNADSLKELFGNEVILDDYSNLSWIRRSHYFSSFYLYSYAISISVASFVANQILNGDKEMLNNYIEFLKAGSDKTPLEIFKILKIDLTKPDVYENAIKYYDNLLDEFETIYNN